MTIVYSAPQVTDDRRRELLYGGAVCVYPADQTSTALTDFARDLITEAFGDLDPQTAQHELPVARMVEILAELKPRFIHHPRSKQLVAELMKSRGCDENTYFDVPRLRTSTSDGYLTTGISYVFHAHRDTWYSAPFNQINWWLPIFPVTEHNAMCFHPRYFDAPVRNSSDGYDYDEWNRTSRFNAATHVGADTRIQPKILDPAADLEPAVTVLPEPGGLMMFSGNQLHSSLPNTSGVTRFSIDFRTVHVGDVAAVRGARNVDSACTGTNLRDFLHPTTLTPVSEELALDYQRAVGSLRPATTHAAG
ncbi:phytanoyl-CoA dioxygenase family protein [Nocardia heshunensis]